MPRRKRALTLLELMIVIVLIGLIGSVMSYNLKGSLDEGRAFKSREGANYLRDLLLLEIAKGEARDQVIAEPALHLRRSGLVSNPSKILKDGWGEDYLLEPWKESDLKVTSKKLRAYEKAKNKLQEEMGED